MHHGTEIDFVVLSLAESCFYRKILSTETVVFLVSSPASVFLLFMNQSFSDAHLVIIFSLYVLTYDSKMLNYAWN